MTFHRDGEPLGEPEGRIRYAARGAVMDVVAWLRSLGLAEYETAFRENKIDEGVLPKLTTEDLKELGVSALGDRRKLLDAITALRTDAVVKAPSVEPPTPKQQETAERRQVTVMFSDLVGSTALSGRMDPEDLREVISAYQKCVAATVERFGGFVAKYMGDGVLIYFGYPQAHEDDAERAVRAGLELVAAVSALKTHSALHTRVGIATGLVVVGDLIGSGASQEQAIVGETPNLAARLQGIAEPNTMVIAESTRKQLGNLFELEDLGPKELKGISGSVRAFAALRPASIEGRFEAFHGSGLTDLVGREEELELLQRRWPRAKNGEGQVVLLSGEAGIGKSRLAAALMEDLAGEPHTRLRYFCSPQHTDSALYPIIGQMERAAGFAHDDAVPVKLDKLDTVLAQSLTPRQDAALFADMLSLPNDGRYPTLELTPQQRRQRTLEALTTQLEALSRQKPVLMIFEDVHWIDPTSLEALGRALDRTRTLGVLLIVTYRPEFEPPWIGQPQVTVLTLNRLGKRDIDAMIERVAGNRGLPENIREDIIERTDGIPLFVEEMTKAVLETGSEVAAAQAISTSPSPAVAVPASLHASLMARLDRLGPAKDVAQIGAVIGREFSYELLAAVARKPESVLASALRSLVTSGLLFQQGAPPQATYLFKHALVQDAAYGTLLREPRRALHARIAEALESQFPKVAEIQPELLARHFTEAGLVDKAVAQWGKAAHRSLERSAMVEAIVQFTTARDLVATLPSTQESRRQQIKLQVALLAPVIGTKGFAAAETKAAIERAQALIEEAEALGEPLDDPLLLLSVLYGFWSANLFGFNGKNLIEISQRILALAERQGATIALMMGQRSLGFALMATGAFSEGRRHLDQAVALYNATEHRPFVTRFAVHAQAANLVSRAMVLWQLGFPNAALSDIEYALREGREIGHAASLMGTLFYASFVDVLCKGHSAERKLTDELLLLAEQKHAPFFAALGTMQRGVVLAVAEDAVAAVPMIYAGISQYRSTNSTLFTPWFLTRLADTQAKLGHRDEAWQRIFEAFEEMEKGGEVQHTAEINRVAGEMALLSPTIDLVKAERYFEKALAVAGQQQTKSWELRAAISLARLWRNQGKRDEARELLAPVYGWFTEGFDTLDLKEAKALLDDLAG